MVGGGTVAIYFNGQTIFSFTHIVSTTQGAGKKLDEVDGRANGMDVIK